MRRNVGWLLGGRGFAGTVSIGYLALAARALGPAGFGTFSLILAYGGAIAALAQFRSWQAVIRYGSVHLSEGRGDRLARLIGFTAVLDVGSALIGAVLAALGVRLAAPLLGWAPDAQEGATLFAAVLLLSTGATATGVLRLYDRFDLITYAEAMGPAVRLVGAAIVWIAGGGVNTMLAVWALAALAESGAQWVAAVAIRRTGIRFGRTALSGAVAENPRIWSFLIQNSFSNSLGLLGEQAGTLAVGGAGGAAAAGAFRVASKLAGALAKPADTMTRALYPELARLAASDERDTLRRVSLRITWIATAAAAAMIVVAWLGGPTLLALISGRKFVFAQPFLLLLTVAAAIDLCGVALEPILNAHGRSGRILTSRAAGAIAYLGALIVLLPVAGAIGAALAAIASSFVIRAALAWSTIDILRTPRD